MIERYNPFGPKALHRRDPIQRADDDLTVVGSERHMIDDVGMAERLQELALP